MTQVYLQSLRTGLISVVSKSCLYSHSGSGPKVVCRLGSDVEITIADGRRFVGKLQMGAARLKDYIAATGQKFTQDEFKADPALQDEVAQWHFKDIDNAIDALGDAAKGYDRGGLRSVAHLGGKGGMRKWVKSGGEYNPSDGLGTSLSDYYDKFRKAVIM